MALVKAIIVPGNGNDIPEDRWRPWLTFALEKVGVKTVNEAFPDPILARKNIWLPHLQALGANENTILIGHSSGAIAAMRYAETHRILGSVLIGVYHTHMDNENEIVSGYFETPWDWIAIRNNQQWIDIFASSDDPFVPIEEARFVGQNLSANFHEYTDRGHFLDSKEFPELVDTIKKHIGV